jgi:hypothetical protein
MSGPSLGTNLAALTDWSTSFAFVDQFKMTRPWYTQSETIFDTGHHRLLDVDEQGWIRGFTRDGRPAPFDHVSTIWNTTDGHARPGLRVLDWEGEGSFDIVGGVRIVSREDHRITFEADPGDMMEIRITDPDLRDNGDYLRNIRIYHEDDAELIEAGVLFNPAFLEKIEDFRVLRFMDWMSANGSHISSWDETRGEGYSQQTVYQGKQAGASVEVMVELANQVGADPWFTIPHLADESYVHGLAEYVRDHLDPGLVARFEYSNEVWNWGFEQTRWANDQAIDRWGGDVQGGWMQIYGERAAWMAEIVADVFGRETGTRALNVFATQGSWPGLEEYALDAPDLVAEGGTAPHRAPFHVYAIAPYFGGSIGAEGNEGRVARWASQGEAGIQAALDFLRDGAGEDSIRALADTVSYHAEVAARYGWQLEAYEGGQHVVDLAGLFGGGEDPARTEFFTTLTARPEMADLYADYLEMWRDNGGGLMAQFSDFSVPGRHGAWGLWESVWADDTPRSEAVERFRDSVPAWWGDDRAPATFDSGMVRADYDDRGRLTGGREADVLFGLDGRDVLRGRGGRDELHGGDDTDRVIGNGGRDRIDGGRGADRLKGGAGADTFVFDRGDTGMGNRADTILDFGRGGDRIDLTDWGLDSFLGGRAFTGTDGEVRIAGDVLLIDRDGDRTADAAIRIAGPDMPGADDVLL